MNLPEAHKLFRETLGISLNPYLDGLMMVLMKKPVIDIIKFDKWAHGKFGEYENAGKSLEDVLTENYGKTISLQISELMGLE